MSIRRYSSTGRRKTKEEILASAYADYRVKCKCGHSVILLKDKIICSWCGRYVYKNKKAEFKDRMRRVLNG